MLVSLAAQLEPRFESFLPAADRLTEYGAAFRYPGETQEPEPLEFHQALRDAEAVHALVLSALPADVRP